MAFHVAKVHFLRDGTIKFARVLNVTPGHIAQIERGAKRATGAALATLHVIRRKGIEVVL